MNQPAYNAELERLIQTLNDCIGNKSLDKLVEQSIKYAYTLGKTDGYVAGVQAVAGDQR
jgi:hypothetical protein